MYFLIYSNVHDNVLSFEVCDSWKTQKPKYFENQTQFFNSSKNIIKGIVK